MMEESKERKPGENVNFQSYSETGTRKFLEDWRKAAAVFLLSFLGLMFVVIGLMSEFLPPILVGREKNCRELLTTGLNTSSIRNVTVNGIKVLVYCEIQIINGKQRVDEYPVISNCTGDIDARGLSNLTVKGSVVTVYCDVQTRSTKDCLGLLDGIGTVESGVYNITINGSNVLVYCDMETDGGGWTVIQKRRDGSVGFNLDFPEYEQGFGNISNEYWLGLNKMHQITATGRYQLRVEIKDWNSSSAFAFYSSFSIGNASTNYTLSVSGFNGTAGDSLIAVPQPASV